MPVRDRLTDLKCRTAKTGTKTQRRRRPLPRNLAERREVVAPEVQDRGAREAHLARGLSSRIPQGGATEVP